MGSKVTTASRNLSIVGWLNYQQVVDAASFWVAAAQSLSADHFWNPNVGGNAPTHHVVHSQRSPNTLMLQNTPGQQAKGSRRGFRDPAASARLLLGHFKASSCCTEQRRVAMLSQRAAEETETLPQGKQPRRGFSVAQS